MNLSGVDPFTYIKQNCEVDLKVYTCLVVDFGYVIRDDVKPF